MTGELRPVVEAGPGEPELPLPEAFMRSAQVYLEEADCLARDDPMRDTVLARAAAFEQAAARALAEAHVQDAAAAVDPGPARRGLRLGPASPLIVFLDPAGEASRSLPPVRTCRVCGCTFLRACDPPCSWIAPDLCSACG